MTFADKLEELRSELHADRIETTACLCPVRVRCARCIGRMNRAAEICEQMRALQNFIASSPGNGNRELSADMDFDSVKRAVSEFAHGMLAVLALPKNVAKGNRAVWLATDITRLMHWLRVERWELAQAIERGESVDRVKSEAHDVANLAMMIADNYAHAHAVSGKANRNG